jgi:hypothetical protein
MGYEDKDEVMDDATSGPSSLLQLGLSAVVRLVGLAVLVVGLWVGIKIILEAWALYEEPSRIVRFADDIQNHSNLDGVIGSLTGEAAQGSDKAASSAKGGNSGGGLRLSYFAAWFIVLLLMFVIGSLAMAAITTGGHLVLYDLQVKLHSRSVVREIKKLRHAA